MKHAVIYDFDNYLYKVRSVAPSDRAEDSVFSFLLHDEKKAQEIADELNNVSRGR